MPGDQPLFCFTANKIEVHPCAKCRAPMVLDPRDPAHLASGARRFACFNCDELEKAATESE